MHHNVIKCIAARRQGVVDADTKTAGVTIHKYSRWSLPDCQAYTGYNIADQFKYVSGDIVANSASDGTPPPAVTNVPGTTNSQKYTASYIVNVAGNQIAGTYTTTLTYICTATF